MEETPESLVHDFRWLVDDIDFVRREFSFVHTSQAELSRQTFLDSRWQRSGRRLRLPIDAVIAALPAADPPPLHFIWHTSFCCSTLLARALEHPRHSLSLREPQILIALADGVRSGALGGGQLPPRTPEAVFNLLGRAPQPHCHIAIKPSNFANILIQGTARRTSGRMLFLYSDLASFLVSMAKGGVQQGRYVRKLFGDIAMDLGQPPRWSAGELLRMSDLEIAALAWHRQIAEFRRSWPALGKGRAASLDCAVFLDDPARVLTGLDAWLGLDLGADHIQSILEGPLLHRHAKEPAQVFTAQMRRQEDQQIRRSIGSTLERVVAWSYRECPETPPAAPLPDPLPLPEVAVESLAEPDDAWEAAWPPAGA